MMMMSLLSLDSLSVSLNWVIIMDSLCLDHEMVSGVVDLEIWQLEPLLDPLDTGQ